MKAFNQQPTSLFWKISALFSLLFLFLSVVFLFLNYQFSKQYYEETTQRLNANVAEHLVAEVKPFEGDSINKEALGKIMHSMMAVNPGLEVYLLDTKGNILSYVVLKEKVLHDRVTLAPILSFIDEKPLPIYGEDPKSTNAKKIFSATKVVQDGKHRGYVYMILHSEEYDTVFSSLQSYYLAKTFGSGFWVSLLAALAISLLLLRLLLKRLNKMVKTVQDFEDGNMNARITQHSSDELGILSKSFNHMADTIKQNIESLKEVDQLRRDLIANISHDVRTPVSVIHGYVETLLMKYETTDVQTQKEYLETILKSTDRLKKLLEDLFELSKLEARQIQVQLEPFLIYDLLADLKKQYDIKAQQQSITFHFKASSRAILVKADPSLIQRVIQNLLDNAFKYTPQGGSIVIEVIQEDQMAKIAVRNSGLGISDEQIDRIFDRYYKVQHDVAKDSTGLGLAIVKNILEIHDVTISVESDGTQTSFSFALPAS